MTIEDVIERFDGSLAYSTNSKEICQYIADLLKELKERRKAPEIVQCGECVNFVERDFCKVAGHNVHRKSNCMQVFGVERRPDDES